MKIAYILYNDFTMLDFVGVYDAVLRLKTMNYIPDLQWDLCASMSPFFFSSRQPSPTHKFYH
jgi:hypothetical protein